jgi:hypothetical protein
VKVNKARRRSPYDNDPFIFILPSAIKNPPMIMMHAN